MARGQPAAEVRYTHRVSGEVEPLMVIDGIAARELKIFAASFWVCAGKVPNGRAVKAQIKIGSQPINPACTECQAAKVSVAGLPSSFCSREYFQGMQCARGAGRVMCKRQGNFSGGGGRYACKGHCVAAAEKQRLHGSEAGACVLPSAKLQSLPLTSRKERILRIMQMNICKMSVGRPYEWRQHRYGRLGDDARNARYRCALDS